MMALNEGEPGGGATAGMILGTPPAAAAPDAAAAAAATAAAAAPDAAAAAAAAAGGATPDWYGTLSAEKQGDAISDLDWLKETKAADVNALVKIARDNQRAVRDGGRIKVPGADAPAEDVAAWHKAIGVPEDTSGYAIEAPTGADGKPVALDTALIERLAGSALKSGMPAAAFKAVIGEVIAQQVEAAAGLDTEQQAAGNAWVKAQGTAGTEKLAAVDRAFDVLGITGAEAVGLRNQLGAAKLLDIFSRIGGSIREDTLSGDGRKSFGLSGTEAKAQMASLRSDATWREKAMIPGTPQNIQYHRLNDMIGEAANREHS